jgi:hypothetical protein
MLNFRRNRLTLGIRLRPRVVDKACTFVVVIVIISGIKSFVASADGFHELLSFCRDNIELGIGK